MNKVLHSATVPGTGTDHTYVDQDVKAAATPQFARLGIGVAADATAGLDVRVELSYFGATQGQAFIKGDSINYYKTINGNAEGYINAYGYNGGQTQFRDLRIQDGKGANVVFVDGSEASVTFAGVIDGPKFKITAEGGYAVKLTNKTGGNSVKGEVVTPYSATAINSAVKKIVVDDPNPIGVFYESGVADGAEAWVVVAGIADVYFVGNTTLGHIARGFLTADGASYVTGQAMSEALPGSPFSADKHFYEMGHIIEARVGAGLAKVVLHFN